jgi:hypothetical protein
VACGFGQEVVGSVIGAIEFLCVCGADGLIFGGGVSGDAMRSVLGDACVIEFSKLTRFVVVGSWWSIKGLLSL